MSQEIDLIVPDLGDFDAVPVIEVYVKAGDAVAQEDPLVALESDKATMDIPAPTEGTIVSLTLNVGDTATSGQVIGKMTVAQQTTQTETDSKEKPQQAVSDTPPSTAAVTQTSSTKTQPVTENSTAGKKLVVIGSGPGGYTAAFRAADLGMEVTLIERYSRIGGVCLNVGCIPSKALLHAAKVLSESREAESIGIQFSEPSIDIEKINNWKNSVVMKLTGGLEGLAKRRKVTVITGEARFASANSVAVQTVDGEQHIDFDQAVIAAGSASVKIPSFPHDDLRVVDSTGALDLHEVPKRMLVVGGGIIGLEMATVYHELGSDISIVEMQPQIIPGADADLIKPLFNRIKAHYSIYLKTEVTQMTAEPEGIRVHFNGDNAPESELYDKVLVSVGRRPNGQFIGAEAAGVDVDERGFIAVDDQQRTNVPHIYAIGDIVGQPMLAHKAVHEGKVAAEVAAGLKSGFDARVIPSVAYTDPEVAWVGLTETDAKAQGIDYEKGHFPWAASGRALSQDRSEGMTKLLFDPKTERVIGGGIVGTNAGDLVNEIALAIEMGSDAADIGLTIHAHPTLSETVGFAAEAFEGTITDLYMPKKK